MQTDLNSAIEMAKRENKVLFVDSYTKVAEKTGAYLMPYFMTKVAINRDLMQNDNLHPNALAQPIIRDFMYSEINKWLSN